jgi:hypothetical protein
LRQSDREGRAFIEPVAGSCACHSAEACLVDVAAALVQAVVVSLAWVSPTVPASWRERLGRSLYRRGRRKLPR